MALTKPTREIVDMGIGLRSGGTLVINGGAITPTEGSHDVDTEGAAASDELDVINPGVTADGGLLLLYATDDARTVEVKTGVGNIFLQDGNNFFLDSTVKSLLLRRDGANFRDIVTPPLQAGYNFIEEKVIAGTPLDLTDLDFDTFASFKINLAGTISVQCSVECQLSQSATFLSGASDYGYQVAGSTTLFNNLNSSIRLVNDIRKGVLDYDEGFSGTLEIFPPIGIATNFRGASILGQFAKHDGVNANFGQSLAAGQLILNLDPIDGIRFFPTAGTFDKIRAQLWGLQK